MAPRESRPAGPSAGTDFALTDDEFIALATRLLETSAAGAVLVTVDHVGDEHHEDLTDADPVTALLTWRAPTGTLAVGLAATASMRPCHAIGVADDADVVHLLDRDGRAVTVVATSQGPVRVFGPHRDPQTGRVPDACRRVLGLPTAPPDRSMTGFVLAAWLEVVVRRALARPGLDWSAVVAMHPATQIGLDPFSSERDCDPGDRTPTPAQIAALTRDLGELLDWDRFRCVVSRVGGFPFGEHASPIAAWMDAGMFSRWATDEIPDRRATLDMLDAVLQPSAFDRVWATISMCGED
jgi:hypothetical protein